MAKTKQMLANEKSRATKAKYRKYTTEKFGSSTEPDASLTMWAANARQVAKIWDNTTDGQFHVLNGVDVAITGWVIDGEVYID
jgi:hypothetical protein